MPSILSPYRPDPKAYAVACAVEEAIKPNRVILFGSRARGEIDAYSDIDLLIIYGLIPLDVLFLHTFTNRKVRQIYGRRLHIDIVQMGEEEFYYHRCERNHIAGRTARVGQAEATQKKSKPGARGMTPAERMQARMREVAEGDLIKRQNGCDWWIRGYLVNRFGAQPNGAYEAVMAGHCLRRGYGTDSHRFDDGSGALWTWDEDGKGDMLTAWSVRADMDREAENAVGEVMQALRGFNGFWAWEMERKDKLGTPRRPVIMEEADQRLAAAEVLMDAGYWVDKFMCGWKERGADRGEKARLQYFKTLFFLMASFIPRPAAYIETREIDIMYCLYLTQRILAPRPAPLNAAPCVQRVHETAAARVAMQHYAEGVLMAAKVWANQRQAAMSVNALRFAAVAMGVGRP